MQLDETWASAVLSSLDEEPGTRSTVDVRRAISEGRRRRRARRVGGYVATAGATVLVLAGTAVAADTWQGQPPASSTGSPAAGSPSLGGSPDPPPVPPTTCQISRLPLPDGRKMAAVTGADPTGRLLLGRTYPDPVESGEYHVVVWDTRRPTVVPMRGVESALNDINTNGVAVGTSNGDTGPVAWLYRDGELSLLPSGDGADARAINEANVVVGVRDRKPVIWPSVDQPPVELPLPAHATTGEALDVDEDGTIVGNVGTDGRDGPADMPYVWQPDRAGRTLEVPELVPVPSSGVGMVRKGMARAYSIRNGWLTGMVNETAIRWDLRTGEADLFPQFAFQASITNRYGWQVGTDPKGRGLLLSEAGPVVLPGLVAHKSGELTDSPETISDDGRVISGHANDQDGVLRAVVWSCA
jgi:hypothetical protein